MKATIIQPPTNDLPPVMPIEAAYIADTLDSLGWGVWVLDVAAFNMAVEAVRVETEKEQPDMVVLMTNCHQYRFVKQYIGKLRQALPESLFVASTDLNPVDLEEWLPELDIALSGVPASRLRLLASRTETKNLDGIERTNPEKWSPKFPEYHPLTVNFEQHARLRGARIIDIPTHLFGEQVAATDVVDTVAMLRLKYAIQGFNLVGALEDLKWLMPIFEQLEAKELVGPPVNLTWTCHFSNTRAITPALIRLFADHGCKVLKLEWQRGTKDELSKIIENSLSSQIQPMINLNFGGELNIHDYLDMAKFLDGHENIPVVPRFVEDENRLDDEEYVSSLTNGLHLPKSMNLHRDIELLATRDLVLSRDLDRLERLAKA